MAVMNRDGVEGERGRGGAVAPGEDDHVHSSLCEAAFLMRRAGECTGRYG